MVNRNMNEVMTDEYYGDDFPDELMIFVIRGRFYQEYGLLKLTRNEILFIPITDNHIATSALIAAFITLMALSFIFKESSSLDILVFSSFVFCIILFNAFFHIFAYGKVRKCKIEYTCTNFDPQIENKSIWVDNWQNFQSIILNASSIITLNIRLKINDKIKRFIILGEDGERDYRKSFDTAFLVKKYVEKHFPEVEWKI